MNQLEDEEEETSRGEQGEKGQLSGNRSGSRTSGLRGTQSDIENEEENLEDEGQE